MGRKCLKKLSLSHEISLSPLNWHDSDTSDLLNNNNNNNNNNKGCCRGSKGCKDQLLMSKAILQECKRRKRICVWHG